MLLYVVILYDERDDVRRAEVLSALTEAGAVEQAPRIRYYPQAIQLS